MATIVNLMLVDKGSPIPNYQVTIAGGQPQTAGPAGFISLVCDGLYQTDSHGSFVTVTVAPPGKQALVTDLNVIPDQQVPLRLDYTALAKQLSGKPEAKTLRNYDAPTWRKFWSALLTVLVPLILLSVGAYYYITQKDAVTGHFLTLQTSGPEVLGGLATVVGVTMILNLIGALLRGERGMMEDAWAPIALVALAIGWKPYIDNRLAWVLENMNISNPSTVFAEGGKAYGLLAFFAGIIMISMVRAVTFQRLEKKLDFDPLIAAVVVIGAFGYYNSFEFAMSLTWWIVVVAVFFIGILWETLKQPLSTLFGLTIGVAVALVGNTTFTLVAFSITTIIVFVVGVIKFVKALDTKAQAPEFVKLMESVPLPVITYGWYAAFIASIMLARFGGVPTP